MRKFQFRLATLLRLREAVRDERRAQLAEALTIADSLQQKVDELAAELRELKAQQAVRPGGVDVDRLLASNRYEMVLRIEQLAMEQQRASVLAEVARRREALVAADRDVRMLEKLRDKQQVTHRAEQERLAMKLMDEVAGRSYLIEESV